MSRFLLDTHALLWALTEPERLGAQARAVVSAKKNTLFVSAASAWEIATKQRIGKMPHADVIVGGYSRHLERLGTEHLPISDEHALLAGRLDWPHRDPFDRMLVAQAMLESLPIVTVDAAISGMNGIDVVW